MKQKSKGKNKLDFIKITNFSSPKDSVNYQGCEATTNLIHCWQKRKTPPYTAGRNTPTLEMSLAVSYKHACNIWPRNPTPRYLLRRKETLSPHQKRKKNLPINISRGFIHKYQKLETTQMCNWWMDKRIVLQRHILTNATTWMNPKGTMLKLHIAWFHLFDIPEKASLHPNKTDEWITARDRKWREGIDYKGAWETFLGWWKCSVSQLW